MSIPFIDLKTQYQAIKEDVNARIQTVLEHGMFVMGPEVKEAEQALAKYVGCKHALTCGNGTDAAMIAMMALDIGPGDEIITTAFSFIATAETILLAGATPVYVDIDPATFNMDASQLEQAITDKTKAIVPVSLYGQPCDMDEINAVADKHGLAVIEDAAQSFGAEYKGKKSCNLSTFGVTSFFPAKPLGCYGDGGAVFTNDDDLANKVSMARNHGQETRYYHTRLGMNARMDTLQCAVILSKLERYPWEVEQRQRIGARYNEKIAELNSDRITLPLVRDDRSSVWAQYTLRVNDRESFQSKMTELGVPTAIHYPHTMPDQPYYKEKGRVIGIEKSRTAANEVISLPMHPEMQDDVQDQIIAAIGKAL